MSNSSIPSLSSVYAQLTSFAKLENFWTLVNTAFGSNYDFATAATFKFQWQSGNFSLFPQIEIVDNSILGKANGAYAISTNRIYLSDQFVSVASQQSLDAVILEEFGHFVDAQVNATDRLGDEGELFSALVRGRSLSAVELSRIKAENDHAVVIIGGQATAIELSAPIILMVNTTIDENDGSATIGQGLSLRDAITIANKNANLPYIIKLESGANYLLGGSLSISSDSLTIEAKSGTPANILASGTNPSSSLTLGLLFIGYNNNFSQKIVLNHLSISNNLGNGVYSALGEIELEINNSIISGNLGNGIFHNGGFLNINESHIDNNKQLGIIIIPDIISKKSTTVKIEKSSVSGNSGGGIQGGSYLTINDSFINNNHYIGINNIGIASVKNSIIIGNKYLGVSNGGTIDLVNTIISGNNVGGIVNLATATLINSIITDNTGSGISNGGKTEISNSVITNNSVSGIGNSGKLNLSKSTISGNRSGGGIYNNTGTVNSSNNVISNNKAANGGGIHNAGGVVNLSDDTITGNYASGFGGGIYNSGTWSSNANISGNTAGAVWYSSYNPLTIDPKYPNVYDVGKLVASPPTPPPPPDSPKPVVSVSNARVKMPAGDNQPKTLEFTVTLSSASDKPIILDYYLLDGSANSLDQNQKQDFVGLSIADPSSNIDLTKVKRTLVFFPGEKIKTIEVPILAKTPNTVTDKTFEIFAKDTAYRPLTDADKGKEVDQVYNYSLPTQEIYI